MIIIAVPPGPLAPYEDATVSVSGVPQPDLVVLLADFPGLGRTELVHDGLNFAACYASSLLTLVGADALSYTIRRASGWPDAPSFRALAFLGGVRYPAIRL